MICVMLDCVRPVSLDIWRVERCICVWPSCLSMFTTLSTVVTFSSVRASDVDWGQTPEDEAEDEDKISASRTVWPRGLNITGTRVRRSAALVPLVGASCFPNDFQISVKCPVSLFAVCLRKLCQYPPWTVFFELVLVLNQWLDFIAEWH